MHEHLDQLPFRLPWMPVLMPTGFVGGLLGAIDGLSKPDTAARLLGTLSATGSFLIGVAAMTNAIVNARRKTKP